MSRPPPFYAPGSGPRGTDGLYDVAVIGQGAVGAAMALAASRAGCRTVCIAPSPGPGSRDAIPTDLDADDWDARVFALSPGSRDLLTRLKIWDALDHRRIAPVYDMRIHAARPDAESPPTVHFSAYEAQIDALAWIVEGRNLDSTLQRALSFSDVTTLAGTLTGLDNASSEASRLTLESGQSLRARLVIGADGARSPTRQLAGLTATVHDYQHTAVVANFSCELAHQDCAYQWFGAPGVLALLPLPGDRCSMVWSAPQSLAEELLALPPRALAIRVTEASDGRLGLLQSLTPGRGYPLTRVDVPVIVGPRLALIGDAAHVIHPLAGQGMNLGFGDVAELAATLAAREPFRDHGDPLLLRRYRRARREPVLTMSLACDGLQRLFEPSSAEALGPLGRPLTQARDLGWRAVASSGWLKRQLVRAAAL